MTISFFFFFKKLDKKTELNKFEKLKDLIELVANSCYAQELTYL